MLEEEFPVTNEFLLKIARYIHELPPVTKVRAYKNWYSMHAGIAVVPRFAVGDLNYSETAVAAVEVIYANTIMGYAHGMFVTNEHRVSELMSIRTKGDKLAANEMMLSMNGYDGQPGYFDTHNVGDQLVHRIHRPIGDGSTPNVIFYMTRLEGASDNERTDVLTVVSTRPISAGDRLIASARWVSSAIARAANDSARQTSQHACQQSRRQKRRWSRQRQRQKRHKRPGHSGHSRGRHVDRWRNLKKKIKKNK